MISVEQLIAEARAAREKAYAPYSNFKVGAAVLTRDGKIYQGCNIENASYGLTNCAERTAFFSAIADGYKPGDFAQIAVVGDTEGPVSPCGACRQVILELGGADLVVILANLENAVDISSPAALLPGAFSNADLSSAAAVS
jgi:cytidine deaminase